MLDFSEIHVSAFCFPFSALAFMVFNTRQLRIQLQMIKKYYKKKYQQFMTHN